ncbi:MAG: sel1 repeat family protein [Deltaproteobacteria bacterium]|nr:sel1 repeat family protein [Deltaproteobacteria bacterium]
MRLVAVWIVLAAGSVAAADPKPCTAGAECERACPATPTACTAGAELYFDGKSGHPLDHKKSFALAKRGCDAGEAHACMLLGYHYQDGLGVAWSPALAVEAYAKGCTKGFGVACYNLSGMYLGAHGVMLDKAKGERFGTLANQHWATACKSGDPRWCANHGFALATAGDLPGARKAHLRACEHGTRVGCVQAARLGYELKALDATAYLAELDRQCKAGEGTGCTLAGQTLYAGDAAIKADRTRGLAQLARGCELGDRMGCMFAGYELSASDPAKSVAYLNMACDRAASLGCVELSRLHAAKKQEPESVAYAVRACRMGNAEACRYAGLSHSLGKGVAKSDREAVGFFTEGCRMADMTSCGLLIRRNEPLPVADDTKQRIYREACAGGIAEACPKAKP